MVRHKRQSLFYENISGWIILTKRIHVMTFLQREFSIDKIRFSLIYLIQRKEFFQNFEPGKSM